MFDKNTESSKRILIYHKLLYTFSILLLLIQFAFKINRENGYIYVVFLFVILFFVTDAVLYNLNFFDSNSFYAIVKYVEAFVYEVLITFFSINAYVYTLLVVLSIVTLCEIIINDYDIDHYTVAFKRIACFIPIFVMSAICLAIYDEKTLILLMFTCVILYVASFYLTEWFIMMEKNYSKKLTKLNMAMSDIESTNEKLVAYRKKVSAINDEINFQRIELSRSNKNLEQANIEIAAQTEIMKYIASSFDIQKCLNVISESIMDVKKTKLCGIYITKDVYYNKEPNCIIKTNYTSMQRRLKKDVEKIFDAVISQKTESLVFVGSQVDEFRFIGDTNIKALAILPMIEKKKPYGIMILGADKMDFFDDGLTFYEDCVAKFNVAMKSTKMYLKMEDMARKDGLTGIFNRIYFGELFKNAIEKVKKNKKNLSVALFDIDKFKNINDTYGHLAGDEVIKMVAKVADTYASSNNGFACRYGGEEFLVVLPDIEEDEVLSILETMHEEIKNTTVIYKDQAINVNVCIGFSCYPNICENTDMLINRADNAMYYGKKHGRGRLVKDSSDLVMLEKK